MSNAITTHMDEMGEKIMQHKAAAPFRKFGPQHYFVLMNTVQSAIEVVDQFQHTGIQVRHGDGWVRMKVQHAHHFEKKEKERAQRKTTAGGATLHVFADTPESVALLNPERVKTGLGKIGLVVTEGPHQPDDNTRRRVPSRIIGRTDSFAK